MSLTKVSYSMLEAAPTTLQAQTWYVNASTGSDTNDGLSPSTAFKTIQYAIDQLPPVIVHRQTIQLADGTYNENNRLAADNPRNAVVFVNEKWISGRTDQTSGGLDTTGYLVIKGTSKAGTIIETTASLTAGIYASECNNVGISTLTIKANDAATTGLLVSHRTGTYVQASSIVLDGNSGQADQGCYAEAGAVLEITGDSEIKGCAAGAVVFNSSLVVIANTTSITSTNTVGVAVSTNGNFFAANTTSIASPVNIAPKGLFEARGIDSSNRMTVSGDITCNEGIVTFTFAEVSGQVITNASTVDINATNWSNIFIARGGDVHVRGNSKSYIAPATANTTIQEFELVSDASAYIEAGSDIVGSDGNHGNTGFISQNVLADATTVILYAPQSTRHFFTGAGALRSNCVLPLVNNLSLPFADGEIIYLCGNTWGVQFIDSTTAQFAGGSCTVGNSAGQFFGVTMMFYLGKWREISRALSN